MRKPFLLLFLTACAAGLAVLFWPRGREAGETRRLTVFCAAGLKQPVEQIAAKYTKEAGVEIALQFGGTGTLLSQLQLAKQGDLFLAADEGSLADARKRGLIREALPLVTQTPVIAVAAGNPKNVRTLADLQQDGLRVALANPEAASIGKSVQKALGEAWPALAARAAVMKPTVTEIAADLSLGAVDAAILWDATVPQFKNIEAVAVPEFSRCAENASAAVIEFCAQPAAALAFARYLAAPEKGGRIWQQFKFHPLAGDPWEARPEMVIYSGGVNRPALESLLQQFSDREGVGISSVYNGCGVLCASMKAMKDAADPAFPDAYFACDLCFVPPVAEAFPEAVILTETDIGIAVKKGNPRGIQTLGDLAAAGVKVGICNAEQSTLGYITRGLLKASALSDAVRKNVAVEVPTADFLINQLRAGALEAAIVYRVNVQPAGEHLDFIPLPQAEAKAVQPFAISAQSRHRQTAARLLDHLKAHRSVFEAAGFQWKGEAPMASKDIVIPEWLKTASEK